MHIRPRDGTPLATPFYRAEPTQDRPWAQRPPRPSSKAAAERRLENIQPGWELKIKPELTTLANGVPWSNFLCSKTAKQVAVVKAVGRKYGGDVLLEFPDGKTLWLKPSECVFVSAGKGSKTKNGHTTRGRMENSLRKTKSRARSLTTMMHMASGPRGSSS